MAVRTTGATEAWTGAARAAPASPTRRRHARTGAATRDRSSAETTANGATAREGVLEAAPPARHAIAWVAATAAASRPAPAIVKGGLASPPTAAPRTTPAPA